MHAYKCYTILPENHRLILDLPPDIPTGAVEIIVLSNQTAAGQDTTAMLEEWRNHPLPQDELEALEAFPNFREANPVRFRVIYEEATHSENRISATQANLIKKHRVQKPKSPHKAGLTMTCFIN